MTLLKSGLRKPSQRNQWMIIFYMAIVVGTIEIQNPFEPTHRIQINHDKPQKQPIKMPLESAFYLVAGTPCNTRKTHSKPWCICRRWVWHLCNPCAYTARQPSRVSYATTAFQIPGTAIQVSVGLRCPAPNHRPHWSPKLNPLAGRVPRVFSLPKGQCIPAPRPRPLKEDCWRDPPGMPLKQLSSFLLTEAYHLGSTIDINKKNIHQVNFTGKVWVRGISGVWLLDALTKRQESISCINGLTFTGISAGKSSDDKRDVQRILSFPAS